MTTLIEISQGQGESPHAVNQIHAPHGRESCQSFKERLLQIAEARGALRYGDFTLSSGHQSGYYFDGRLLTSDPEGACVLGQGLLPIMGEMGISAVGGPTLGADPIATAIAVASWLSPAAKPIPAFFVRKEPKGHGLNQLVEGQLPQKGENVVAIVDDTCTTGGSLLRAISAAEGAGCKVGLVMVVLDRNEGGSEEIRQRGYRFEALLQADDEGRIKAVDDRVY